MKHRVKQPGGGNSSGQIFKAMIRENYYPCEELFGALVSGAFGMAQTAYNNAEAAKRAEQDRRENYMYGEMAAQNADARTRGLYNDFYSPSALLKQYQEAGLSPSMMFGGTPGQSGMSGAQGTGATGPQTPFMPYSIVEAAQAAALFAQAKKTEKESELVEPMSESTIAKNLADAGHAKAAAAALEAQEAGTKLDNYVKEHTQDANIYTICELAEQAAYTSEKMYNEMRSAKVLAELDEQLFETKLEEGKKQLELLTTNILNTKANTKLTEEQKKAVRVDMLNSIDEMNLKWKQLDLEEKKTTTYTDWINAQLPYIEKQLEIKLKELGVAQWRLVVDGVTNTIKAIAIGAGSAAALKKGGQGIPTYQSGTLPTPGLTIM